MSCLECALRCMPCTFAVLDLRMAASVYLADCQQDDTLHASLLHGRAGLLVLHANRTYSLPCSRTRTPGNTGCYRQTGASLTAASARAGRPASSSGATTTSWHQHMSAPNRAGAGPGSGLHPQNLGSRNLHTEAQLGELLARSSNTSITLQM